MTKYLILALTATLLVTCEATFYLPCTSRELISTTSMLHACSLLMHMYVACTIMTHEL